MVWLPQIDDRVVIHYRAEVREHMPFFGRRGEVVRVIRGPGPVKVEIELDPPDNRRIVLPWENLVPLEEWLKGKP
jgi:hypothetical protein